MRASARPTPTCDSPDRRPSLPLRLAAVCTVALLWPRAAACSAFAAVQRAGAAPFPSVPSVGSFSVSKSARFAKGSHERVVGVGTTAAVWTPRGGATAAQAASVRRRGGERCTVAAASSDGGSDAGGDLSPPSVKGRINTRRKSFAVGLSLALAIWKRDWILSALSFVRSSDLRGRLISSLDAVNDLGTPGLVAYSLLFAIWEMTVGMTTPVETAAGMAFGLRRGIIASAAGKIGGAIAAYFIGHLFLQDYVKEKLRDNEMMGLVEESIRDNPVGVALIWRFSFLPEFMKNFGLSVLPIAPKHFLTAVFLHGFPFTCLWTFLGAETGALARGLVEAPSRSLKIIISGVYFFGENFCCCNSSLHARSKVLSLYCLGSFLG